MQAVFEFIDVLAEDLLCGTVFNFDSSEKLDETLHMPIFEEEAEHFRLTPLLVAPEDSREELEHTQKVDQVCLACDTLYSEWFQEALVDEGRKQLDIIVV